MICCAFGAFVFGLILRAVRSLRAAQTTHPTAPSRTTNDWIPDGQA